MIYEQIKPIRAWHTNFLIRGGKYPDLPCTHFPTEEPSQFTSTYKVSFWKRVKFLFNGMIHVTIVCERHPPVAVGIGELFKKEKV